MPVGHHVLLLCKDLSLFGGKIVGIDGSFFSGDASKKTIYTKEQLKKSLDIPEQQIEHYYGMLDTQDKKEKEASDDSCDKQLTEKIAKLKAKQTEKKHSKKSS